MYGAVTNVAFVLSFVCIISYPFVPLAHSLDSFRFGCLSVYDKARLIDKG